MHLIRKRETELRNNLAEEGFFVALIFSDCVNFYERESHRDRILYVNNWNDVPIMEELWIEMDITSWYWT